MAPLAHGMSTPRRCLAFGVAMAALLPSPIAWARPAPPTSAGAGAAEVVERDASRATTDNDAFDLVTEGPDWSLDRPWELTLVLLGGVEFSASFGAASISTGIVDESGHAIEVASGSAAVTDWGIGLYWAPSETGFFLRPRLGYLSQAIDVADFRADLPQVVVPDALDIGGRCVDLDASTPIDCDSPNVYRIDVSGVHAGFATGVGLVAGTPVYHLLSHLGVGVDLLGYRHVSATLGDFVSEGDSWAFMPSFEVELGVGLHLPAYHWAVRAAAAYEVASGFAFEEPLRFAGPVVFDSAAQVYRRPTVRVEDASLSSWTLQLATAYVF